MRVTAFTDKYDIIDSISGSGGGGMDIENRLDRLENSITKMETLLTENLSWLKDSIKEFKEESRQNRQEAVQEVKELRKHSETLVYTCYGLVLTAIAASLATWYSVWSTNNSIIQFIYNAIHSNG